MGRLRWPRCLRDGVRLATDVYRPRGSEAGLPTIFWRTPYNLNSPDQRSLELIAGFVASGYAAVWAHENTREALFDAMMRKETYATTGSRMLVRFFGGWDFSEKDALRRDLAIQGYSRGVPMGGDLLPGEGAPSFLVYALRDPIGANLDRIQIVKGWLDSKGKPHEKVYNVAWSDGREADANGNLPPVGNTVDIEAANWINSIGASELGTVWTDPDFDEKQNAFYYARVIEIPTPRWVVYDAFRYGIEIPEGAETTHQERAYTAPIWYTP